VALVGALTKYIVNFDTAFRFYCPRPGLQSTKPNASVSRKLAIEMVIVGAIGYSISASRAIRAALIRSGKRLFHDFGISRRKLLLKFGLHGIHLWVSKLPFAAIDFNDNKTGLGDRSWFLVEICATIINSSAIGLGGGSLDG
jgi:hypothetical protein